MTVKVRERQYAIGISGKASSKLETANVETCIAFAGINKKEGMVFLCHINSPDTAKKLVPLIVADLTARKVSLDGFKLYTSIGCAPWLPVAAGTICSFASAFRFLGYLPAAILAVAVGWIFWWLTTLKNTALLKELRHFRVFKAEPEFLGYKFAVPGIFRSRVRVDADRKDELPPQVKRYGRFCSTVKVDDYLKPTDPAMVKAEGSE